jgi:hypothetical protein
MGQVSSSVDIPPRPTDASGLQAYLLAILHAEQAGDVDTVQKLADGLRLPDATQWLNNAFGVDQTSGMAEKYDRSFIAFRSRLIESFKNSDDAATTISIKHPTNRPQNISSSSDATPRAPVEIQTFQYVLMVPHKGRSEWEDSYVRVDGTLRFIGQGAFPFWAGLRTIEVKSKVH